MSYTRQLWNDVLTCRRAKPDSIELLLVASFLALLPITFYIASYINSPDVSSNILQRELSHSPPPYLTVLAAMWLSGGALVSTEPSQYWDG